MINENNFLISEDCEQHLYILNLFVYLCYFSNFTSQFPRGVQRNQTYLIKLIDNRVQIL